MKALIYQQKFLTDSSKAGAVIDDTIKMLESCDPSVDIIVLSEGADIPCAPKTYAEYDALSKLYTERLLTACRETAVRCNCLVFVNAARMTKEGYRNTTYAFDRQGNLAGVYDKQHLTAGEITKTELYGDYTFEPAEPTIIEIDGIRFAFLTCYDFYFYEAFSFIAQRKPDVIIGCARQRTDPHSVTEFSVKNCAYVTGAYVLRAGVSMAPDSEVGGTSMAVAPDGRTLAQFTNEVGALTFEFDPHAHYLKPMGYGNPVGLHHDYTEIGRRPWKYRPAGAAIIRDNFKLPYPRICAHRGFSTVAPENSMPAFGAAVALGAQEIEFDLWETADHEIVSIHDPTLERVSNGSGKVYEKALAELNELDFGCKFGEKFKGLRIVRFEEILKKFACQVIMNIHIKSADTGKPLPEEYLKHMIALIDKYDCRKHVYFMTENDCVQRQLSVLAPDIERCVGENQEHFRIVDRAIELNATRVQLFKPYFNDEMIAKAKAHGIKLNVFFADDPDEARSYLERGVDCILTNDYLRIKTALEDKI